MSRGPFGPNMDHAYYYEGKAAAYKRALALVSIHAPENGTLLALLQAHLEDALNNKAYEEGEE